MGEGANVSPHRTQDYFADTGTGSIYIWFTPWDDDVYGRQGVNVTSSLTLDSDTAGVIKFTGAQIFNPTITSTIKRWGATHVSDVFDDQVFAMNAADVNYLGLSGEDAYYDGAVGDDGAWLYARVDYEVIGFGETSLTLSEPPSADGPRIVHAIYDEVGDEYLYGEVADEYLFGGGTITVVPEPSSAVLLLLTALGLLLYRRRRGG